MTPGPLEASEVPLSDRYDVALLDLDGVVYVGPDAVPGVPELVARAAGVGLRFGYVTNNAARSPHQVGEHLRALGLAATDEQVITSAQAASRLLHDRLPAGSPVLITGTPALAAEVELVGLRPVWSADDEPAGVVQGYNPEMSWAMLAEACVAVRAGAFWVATNTDSTLPSPRGPLPGNGSFVTVVAQTTGAVPVVAGKPEPAMHAECLRRTGAERPIVVGDRLDTDIEGSYRVGVPSLLVFSGLAVPADLLAAREDQRPTYLASDLGGILTQHPPVEQHPDGARCGGWQVRHQGGSLALAALRRSTPLPSTHGLALTEDDCDALRALAVVAWEVESTKTVAADELAAAVLKRLGLPQGD
ncbi:MAG: HAD-IIA family hydrolase [Actinomycetota bacterium]|nr:HAD-IIA family hydrolase [Actinomycetota bacterium]MDQ3734219.1 HAD-IIA family hydrolase [Actinomycetota bacterium]